MTANGLSGRRTASLALSERVARHAFLALAVVAGLAAAAVVTILATGSARFFSQIAPARLLTDPSWTPLAEDPQFGIVPLVAATGQIVVGAAVVAFPLGLLTAIHLQYYASGGARSVLTAAVAVLAAVPTVVYGYVALNFLTPALRAIWPGIAAFNGLSACLAVGVMILPTVTLLSRSALGAVPHALIDVGIALGATRARTLTRVAIPAAAGGIAASMALAIARAAGETMIVTLAAGNRVPLSWNPLEGLRTLTAFIAQSSMGDIPSGTIEHNALVTVASVLFLGTCAVSAAARWLGRRSERAVAALAGSGGRAAATRPPRPAGHYSGSRP